MRRRASTGVVAAFAVAASVLGACGQGAPGPEVATGSVETGGEATGEPVRTLATVPGWREELPGMADGRLEIAYERGTAERAFAENVPDDLPTDARHVAEDGLHAELATVDWDREVLVVWSAGRSGSCPVWVEDLRTDGGRIAVDIASPSQGSCTMDFNPYRAVLAVTRDRLPPAADLPVPVGSETGVEAVVYPAGGS